MGCSWEGVNLPPGNMHTRSQSWQSQKEQRLHRLRSQLDDKLHQVCTFQPNSTVAAAKNRVALGHGGSSGRGRGSSSGSDSPERGNANGKGEEVSQRLYYQGLNKQKQQQQLLRDKLEQQFQRICPFKPNAESHTAESFATAVSSDDESLSTQRRVLRPDAFAGRRSASPRVHFREEEGGGGRETGRERGGGSERGRSRDSGRDGRGSDGWKGGGWHEGRLCEPHYMAPLRSPTKQYTTADKKLLEELQE